MLSTFSELTTLSKTNQVQTFKHTCQIEPVDCKTAWYFIIQGNRGNGVIIDGLDLTPKNGKSISFRRLVGMKNVYAIASAPLASHILRNNFPQSCGMMPYNMLYGSNATYSNLHQDYIKRGFAVIAVCCGSKKVQYFYPKYKHDIALSLGIDENIPHDKIFVTSCPSPHFHTTTLHAGDAIMLPA